MTPLSDLLVVGLGNPGSRYAGTRHNVGAAVAGRLAERHGGRLRDDTKVSAGVGDVRIDGVRVHLAVPITFMNESGRAVSQLLRRHEVDGWDRLVIVHDELDLPEGTLKVKLGGGLAGHNGLRSIVQHVGTQDFGRVRIGIGKPPGGSDQGAGWVLAKVTGAAKVELDADVDRAADAVECIAAQGVQAAMQRFNARPAD